MSVPLTDSNSQPADGEVSRYHSVSPWAICAFVLGLLSPLALVGPLLWLLPISCAVVALIAMRKISSSGGELVGWNIALMGLLLAMLFGITAPVHTLTRHYWLETRAEAFANQFTDLLQEGRAFAAYQLTLDPRLRKPLEVDLSAEYAKDTNAQKKFDDFSQREPAKILLAQRSQATVEQLQSKWLSSDEDSDRVAVRYRIAHQENGSTVPLEIQLTLSRFLDGKTGGELWRISSSEILVD
jgi:hypothetical protein